MDYQNKLNQYFDNNYQKLQQQISIFIKGFPLIYLNKVNSINQLIGLIIKQNGILMNRFRDQLVQIKQNYKRSESVSSQIRKNLDDANSKIKMKDEIIKQKQIKIQQLEYSIQQHIKELKNYKVIVEESLKQKKSFIQIQDNIIEIKTKLFIALNQLLQGRISKNSQVFQQKLSSLMETIINFFKKIKTEEGYIDIKIQIQQQFHQFSKLFQQKVKIDKSKYKLQKQKIISFNSIFQNHQNHIQQFIYRSKQSLKLYNMINFDKALVSKYFQDLQSQLGQLSTKTKISKQKISQAMNAKKTIEIENLKQSKQKNNSFQNTIQAIVSFISKSNLSGNKNKKLSQQIAQLKSKLKQQQQKLNNQILIIKKAAQQIQSKLRQQIKAKQDMMKFYEESLLEWKQRFAIQQKRNKQQKEDLSQLQQQLKQKSRQIEILSQQINGLNKKVEKAQKVIILVQNEKVEIQKQLEQKQREGRKQNELFEKQLNKIQQNNKVRVEKYEKQIQGLKNQYEFEKNVSGQLKKSLENLKQKMQRQKQVLIEKNKKNNELQQFRKNCEKQRKELEKLISQLEQKLKEKSQQYRNKQSLINQQQKKIKHLLNENKQNLQNLKELKLGFQNMKIESNKVKQINIKLNDQNNNLKNLVKIAKVDINQSRKKINDIIQIENQKQNLKIKCQSLIKNIKNYTHNIQQLQIQNKKIKKQLDITTENLKQFDYFKNSNLSLTSQNHRLSIELKHLKNFIHKIQQLKSVI